MKPPLWFRHQHEDLDEEIESHLQMAVRDRIERGETIEAATLAARREFGNAIRVREETRDVWGWIWMEHFWQDVQFAWRLCLKSPAFTATAVLSVALGIGGNSAIFTLLDAVVLKRLQVSHPEQLVIFSDLDKRGETTQYAYRDYLELRDDPAVRTVLTGLAARSNFGAPVKYGGSIESANLSFVSPSYFEVFRISASLGRTISADDEATPASPVVMLGYDFWKRRFAGDPTVLGHIVEIANHPFRIIGVAPGSFAGLNLGRPDQFLLPISVLDGPPYEWGLKNPKNDLFHLVGRLPPGVSPRQAESVLTATLQRSHQKIADTVPWRIPQVRTRYVKRGVSLTPGSRGIPEGFRSRFARPLAVLMALVALVLVIACANVANLLLARASARHREIEVRLALGASRGRLARQLLTESLLLATAGGALGVLIAWWSCTWVVATLSFGHGHLQRPPELSVTPDLRVLAFTLGLSTLTGLIFGVAPVVQAFRGAVAPSMRTVSADDGSTMRIRRLLIVAQVGVAVSLLATAGLFVRTLWNLKHLETGIDRAHVLLVGVLAERFWQSSLVTQNLVRAHVLEQIEAVPGVRAAALSQEWTFRSGYSTPILVDDRLPELGDPPKATHNLVTSRYFETLGITLVRGRIWSPAEDASPPEIKPAVINQTLARMLFAGADPLGHQVRSGGLMFEIVGVVQDATYVELRDAPKPALFGISSARKGEDGAVLVRASVEPSTIVPAIRRVLADEDIDITYAQTLEEYTLNSISEDRIVAVLSSVLGAVAASLAAIGVYGVIAFSVARRTREIGVRIALGATRADILQLVIGELFLLFAAGLVVGLLTTTAVTRFTRTLLFGISPTDGTTLAAAAVLMCAVVAIACYMPAKRAVASDAVSALRGE